MVYPENGILFSHNGHWFFLWLRHWSMLQNGRLWRLHGMEWNPEDPTLSERNHADPTYAKYLGYIKTERQKDQWLPKDWGGVGVGHDHEWVWRFFPGNKNVLEWDELMAVQLWEILKKTTELYGMWMKSQYKNIPLMDIISSAPQP